MKLDDKTSEQRPAKKVWSKPEIYILDTTDVNAKANVARYEHSVSRVTPGPNATKVGAPAVNYVFYTTGGGHKNAVQNVSAYLS